MNLKKNQFKEDFRKIDDECNCFTCNNYTRAYLHTIASEEATASTLISIHNVSYQVFKY
jgi:tRNA-guanine family transglycosylase